MNNNDLFIKETLRLNKKNRNKQFDIQLIRIDNIPDYEYQVYSPIVDGSIIISTSHRDRYSYEFNIINKCTRGFVDDVVCNIKCEANIFVRNGFMLTKIICNKLNNGWSLEGIYYSDYFQKIIQNKEIGLQINFIYKKMF